MINRYILALVLSQLMVFLNQSPSRAEAYNRIDAALGLGVSKYTGAFSISHLFGFFEKDKLKIGGGIRYSFFSGNGLDFNTADASLIKDRKIDNLKLGNAFNNAVNLNFQINYTVFSKLEFGFNIDLIGFGFGAARVGEYKSQNAYFAQNQEAAPSSLNLFQAGSSDKGTLNSEFYFAFWINEHYALRGGYSHFIVEYTTKNPLAFDNKRFRYSADLVFLAVSYAI